MRQSVINYNWIFHRFYGKLTKKISVSRDTTALISADVEIHFSIPEVIRTWYRSCRMRCQCILSDIEEEPRQSVRSRVGQGRKKKSFPIPLQAEAEVRGLLIDGKVRIQPWRLTPLFPLSLLSPDSTPPQRERGEDTTPKTACMHNAQHAETTSTLQIACTILSTIDDVIPNHGRDSAILSLFEDYKITFLTKGKKKSPNAI